ncbi:MAG: hypothetical protein KC503_28850 [Myxococcales bacterium]|nr:hypothetical protein [Myxococcales bacterium]
MLNRFDLFVIIVTLLPAAGCKRERSPLSSGVQKTALPEIKVTKSSKQLYTFFDGSEFKSVQAVDKIPAGRRGWVRVVDLGLAPTKRRDHELVYVADLRKARADGAFPYVVMSRVAFEMAARNRGGGVADPPGKAQKRPAVILYATSWCGACRAARKYMKQKGIQYVEKDIEKDAGAAAELMRKAKAAGISASGVPVLDIKGKLMQGFNPQKLEQLLGSPSA